MSRIKNVLKFTQKTIVVFLSAKYVFNRINDIVKETGYLLGCDKYAATGKTGENIASRHIVRNPSKCGLDCVPNLTCDFRDGTSDERKYIAKVPHMLGRTRQHTGDSGYDFRQNAGKTLCIKTRIE